MSDTDTTDQSAASAPPAPENENPGAPPAAGDVWEHGEWHFEGGRYVWFRGRWEHPRPGFGLVQAHWVEDHGKWVRHPSRWERAAERHDEKREEVRPAERRPNEGKPGERPEEHRPEEHR